MLGCIIPYMYFANIGDIARRLPPRQFNSRLSRILYQIGVGLLIMIVFGGLQPQFSRLQINTTIMLLA